MCTFRSIVSVGVMLILGSARFVAAQQFSQHNLVSDQAGVADLVDPNLVNAWGLAAGPATFWWVANNETNTSTLYDGTTGAKQALEVAVPGNPTGVVYNGGPGFVIADGGSQGPAVFIFASEAGIISGWNPNVPPPAPSHTATVAPTGSAGNVYKGLALASTANGDLLYATNFSAGTVDVYDGTWQPVTPSGGFVDPHIPAGYAPFGIANLGGTIFVTYAMQDADKHDDVAGPGHGFVDAFDTDGNLLHRIASRDHLNSPWGLALAPAGLGKFSTDLLIGNFGDGRINAFRMKPSEDGEFHHHGSLQGADGRPLTIDGLWSLAFGNGAKAGPTTTLFFTAGPDDESHGLFGTLTAEPSKDHHDDHHDQHDQHDHHDH